MEIEMENRNTNENGMVEIMTMQDYKNLCKKFGTPFANNMIK